MPCCPSPPLLPSPSSPPPFPPLPPTRSPPIQSCVCACVQEPDSYGIRWEATATRPGYGDLMLTLMDALYPILPGALFFIEGVDQECESVDPPCLGTPAPGNSIRHIRHALPVVLSMVSSVPLLQ